MIAIDGFVPVFRQKSSSLITVFPRNVAAVRFYFKALYHAAIIQGQLDFEGGIYGDQYARAYTASIISLFVCTYNARVHADIVIDPVPCGEISRAAFIGMLLAEICGDILRGRDFEVRREFEEIRYS